MNRKSMARQQGIAPGQGGIMAFRDMATLRPAQQISLRDGRKKETGLGCRANRTKN